jgi:hypothetical protein
MARKRLILLKKWPPSAARGAHRPDAAQELIHLAAHRLGLLGKLTRVVVRRLAGSPTRTCAK